MNNHKNYAMISNEYGLSEMVCQWGKCVTINKNPTIQNDATIQKRRNKLFLCGCLLIPFIIACSKSDTPADPPPEEVMTANVQSNTYTGYFLYGSNMGWLNNNWRDEDVADILVGNPSKSIEGAGVISLRPSLHESFVEAWGYDNRAATFQYYENMGAKANVVFIGDWPCDAHRERKQHTSAGTSQSFENLYEPIWNKGESGTSVNENNHYAIYVFELVKRYKNQVKFWEIKNEPDLTHRSDLAGAAPGTNGNWWDNDPLPEQLVNWYAPIQSYIRMLRISYEVIKHVDPTAFVCVGGIGYHSFLDAILRNTDNPDGGKVTTNYPFKGGAWFDCLSFHCYPMYYLRSWAGSGFNHFRHSDAAVDALINHQNEFDKVLRKHGYGGQYPTKEVIVTETNVPSKQVGEFIGSSQAQRNYLVKAAVMGQKNGISGIYPFCVWDGKEQWESGWEYDYMGFYKPLPNTPGGTLRINESGVAWRTVSRMLRERRYDATETTKLSLPSGVGGTAFYSAKTSDYIYVLWAKTTVDLSETASVAYTFPTSIVVNKMQITSWDGTSTEVNGRAINLTGSPVFVKCL
jgi:outer membrane lipoprotein-sorting protein